MHASQMGLPVSLPLLKDWCPHSGKETVRKCASYLGHAFHNFQWSRYPLQRAVIEALIHFLKTSLNYHCPITPSHQASYSLQERKTPFEIYNAQLLSNENFGTLFPLISPDPTLEGQDSVWLSGLRKQSKVGKQRWSFQHRSAPKVVLGWREGNIWIRW